MNATVVAEYSDTLGQANIRLYRYSGNAEQESVKAYVEKLPCKMLYAYFYPDSIPLSQVPDEEIRAAKTFSEVQDILFNGEGYAQWRFAARCFAVIPIVTECGVSRVSQDCR